MVRYNKLVRDRIPELIEENGETCTIEYLKGDTYSTALREKLKEEVTEYLTSNDATASMEERADILEVLHHLASLHQQTLINLFFYILIRYNRWNTDSSIGEILFALVK